MLNPYSATVKARGIPIVISDCYHCLQHTLNGLSSYLRVWGGSFNRSAGDNIRKKKPSAARRAEICKAYGVRGFCQTAFFFMGMHAKINANSTCSTPIPAGAKMRYSSDSMMLTKYSAMISDAPSIPVSRKG